MGPGWGSEGRSELPGAVRQHGGWAEALRYHEAPVSDGRTGLGRPLPLARAQAARATGRAHLQAPRRRPFPGRAAGAGRGAGGWGRRSPAEPPGAPAGRLGLQASGVLAGEAWTQPAVIASLPSGGVDIYGPRGRTGRARGLLREEGTGFRESCLGPAEAFPHLSQEFLIPKQIGFCFSGQKFDRAAQELLTAAFKTSVYFL